jgi:hypothetical protein
MQRVGSLQGEYKALQVWDDGQSQCPFVTKGIRPLPSGSLLQENCSKTFIQEQQMKSPNPDCALETKPQNWNSTDWKKVIRSVR